MERASSKRLAEFGSPRFGSECLSTPRRLDPLVLSNYIRQIVAMKDDELELFVDDWMARKKKTYAETEIWAGSGDKGRDISRRSGTTVPGICSSASSSRSC